MSKYFQVNTNGNPLTTLSGIFAELLKGKAIDFVFAASATKYSPVPMPTLFADSAAVAVMDPFAPAATVNAARQAAQVLRRNVGKKVALVMRPCEIRALIELVKLNQADLTDTILVGMECLGRMERDTFLEAFQQQSALSVEFSTGREFTEKICNTCASCTQFQPVNVDLSVALIGLPLKEQLGFIAGSEAGADMLRKMKIQPQEEPAERAPQIEKILQERKQNRDQMFQRTSETIQPMENFQGLIADCLNCYNCRNACPVCYCNQCVLCTDVFNHPPEVLMRRAEKKGGLKLPADTTMFHLTRLAHMAHACIGCGHCSSVCPSHIPVADFFRTVAAKVQRYYGYEPGRSLEDSIPLTVLNDSPQTDSKGDAPDLPKREAV